MPKTKTKKVAKKQTKKNWEYNPSLKDFLSRKKDISLMGLWWAGYWRIMLIVLGAYIILILLIG